MSVCRGCTFISKTLDLSCERLRIRRKSRYSACWKDVLSVDSKYTAWALHRTIGAADLTCIKDASCIMATKMDKDVEY
jgi:hypothetical protein